MINSIDLFVRCTKGARDHQEKGLHVPGSPEGGIGGKALLTAGGATG